MRTEINQRIGGGRQMLPCWSHFLQFTWWIYPQYKVFSPCIVDRSTMFSPCIVHIHQFSNPTSSMLLPMTPSFTVLCSIIEFSPIMSNFYKVIFKDVLILKYSVFRQVLFAFSYQLLDSFSSRSCGVAVRD